jgi:hypothetical protein
VKPQKRGPEGAGAQQERLFRALNHGLFGAPNAIPAAVDPSTADMRTLENRELNGVAMNTLILTIALIFLPGFIWARLDARYARQVKPTQSEFVINVFVFGLVAYLATYLIYLLPFISGMPTFDFTNVALEDDQVAKTIGLGVVDDILVATLMAVVLAPVWLLAQRYKIIVRFL